MGDVLPVGMGEVRTVRAAARGASPPVLLALGLRSCVGLCAYDPVARVAGLAHIVLPEGPSDGAAPARYAHAGVEALLQEMGALGARAGRVRAVIVGGAQIFRFEGSERHAIGPRNVEAVETALAQRGIPVVARDAGGSAGRTVRFDPETGAVRVTTLGSGERCLAGLAAPRMEGKRRGVDPAEARAGVPGDCAAQATDRTGGRVSAGQRKGGRPA